MMAPVFSVSLFTPTSTPTTSCLPADGEVSLRQAKPYRYLARFTLCLASLFPALSRPLTLYPLLLLLLLLLK